MTNKMRMVIGVCVLATAGVAAVPLVVAQDTPQAPQAGQRVGPPPIGRGPMGPGPMGPMGRGRGGPGGPMGMFGPGLQELGLSDAQRDQVRAIHESHRDEFQQLAEKVRTAREGLTALIEAETIDEAAIRAKAADVAAAEADVAILNAKVRAEVFSSVLTPEQQQKARELRAQRDERRKEMAGRVRGRMQQMRERVRERLARA
jgi:Spy/CpxP family protein refolding chaperone